MTSFAADRMSEALGFLKGLIRAPTVTTLSKLQASFASHEAAATVVSQMNQDKDIVQSWEYKSVVASAFAKAMDHPDHKKFTKALIKASDDAKVGMKILCESWRRDATEEIRSIVKAKDMEAAVPIDEELPAYSVLVSICKFIGKCAAIDSVKTLNQLKTRRGIEIENYLEDIQSICDLDALKEKNALSTAFEKAQKRIQGLRGPTGVQGVTAPTNGDATSTTTPAPGSATSAAADREAEKRRKASQRRIEIMKANQARLISATTAGARAQPPSSSNHTGAHPRSSAATSASNPSIQRTSASWGSEKESWGAQKKSSNPPRGFSEKPVEMSRGSNSYTLDANDPRYMDPFADSRPRGSMDPNASDMSVGVHDNHTMNVGVHNNQSEMITGKRIRDGADDGHSKQPRNFSEAPPVMPESDAMMHHVPPGDMRSMGSSNHHLQGTQQHQASIPNPHPRFTPAEQGFQSPAPPQHTQHGSTEHGYYPPPPPQQQQGYGNVQHPPPNMGRGRGKTLPAWYTQQGGAGPGPALQQQGPPPGTTPGEIPFRDPSPTMGRGIGMVPSHGPSTGFQQQQQQPVQQSQMPAFGHAQDLGRGRGRERTIPAWMKKDQLS